MLGIILAGGEGTRCYPNTLAVSKHLLPLYDKPIIYYPIAFLFNANIKDIVIITSSRDINSYKTLLGDGSRFGVKFRYLVQEKALGTAHAIMLAKNLIGYEGCILVYGDNYISSDTANKHIKEAEYIQGATIFAHKVDNPQSYGIIEFSNNNKVVSIEEKPEQPKSNYAMIGLMCFDQSVCEKIEQISLSKRGEYEITDVVKCYLDSNKLYAIKLEESAVWSDLGTQKAQTSISYSLMIDEENSKQKKCCLEEIAYKNGWITSSDLLKNIEKYVDSSYGQYLVKLINHTEDERKKYV